MKYILTQQLLLTQQQLGYSAVENYIYYCTITYACIPMNGHVSLLSQNFRSKHESFINSWPHA